MLAMIDFYNYGELTESLTIYHATLSRITDLVSNAKEMDIPIEVNFREGGCHYGIICDVKVINGK